MSRLMSCAETEQAVLDRTKTETRRLGWWTDKNGRRLLQPGDRLTLVRKSMGRRRKDGTLEPLVRLAEVEVTSVHRERLFMLTEDAVDREGVDPAKYEPYMTAGVSRRIAWISWFAVTMRCESDDDVTVIRWRYLAVPCPKCRNQFEGRMPGHVYGSNWDWVPCQTCRGEGFVPLDGES